MNVCCLKRYLSMRIGVRMIVIYYGSRNKIEKYDGFLFKIYNKIFVMKLGDGTIKCFSYCDILTKTIRIYI